MISYIGFERTSKHFSALLRGIWPYGLLCVSHASSGLHVRHSLNVMYCSVASVLLCWPGCLVPVDSCLMLVDRNVFSVRAGLSVSFKVNRKKRRKCSCPLLRSRGQMSVSSKMCRGKCVENFKAKAKPHEIIYWLISRALYYISHCLR